MRVQFLYSFDYWNDHRHGLTVPFSSEYRCIDQFGVWIRIAANRNHGCNDVPCWRSLPSFVNGVIVDGRKSWAELALEVES